MTKLLLPCLTQVENFFNNTMSFMKFEDEGGVIPRAETTVSSDSIAPLASKVIPPEPSFRTYPTCTPGGQKR
jgi:hypothetical protein